MASSRNFPLEAHGPSEIPVDIKDAWERSADRLDPFAGRLRCYGTVSSTNDLALRLAAAGAEDGTTLVADAQTAGRGRRGREWFSPPGAGLYASVVLRPAGLRAPSAPSNASARLTLTAGVAVAEGVRAATGLPVELKWPNDVVFDRRKLAGVLAELSSAPGAGRLDEAVVIGIGVNVGTAAYPADLKATATSLERELGRPVDRGLVLVEMLSALAARYRDLQRDRFDAILEAWRRLAPSLPGTAIEWDGPGGVRQGRVVDVAPDGALLARTGDEVVRVVAGEIRWGMRD